MLELPQRLQLAELVLEPEPEPEPKPELLSSVDDMTERHSTVVGGAAEAVVEVDAAVATGS